jgi:hypothetical protein
MTSPKIPADVDLDMLAYDIADMLSVNEYPIDASQDDIRPHLPAFIAAIVEATSR